MDVVLSGLCGGGDWVRGVVSPHGVAAANDAAAEYATARARAVVALSLRGGVVLPAVLPPTLPPSVTPSARFASPSALVHARRTASKWLTTGGSGTADAAEEERAALEAAVRAHDALRCAWFGALGSESWRVAWPVLWAWPASALGDAPPTGAANTVHCSAAPWDAALLRAHAAAAAMRGGDATAAAAHWRDVLLTVGVRWRAPARARRALPGWRTRLAEPELNTHAVLAMLHVCRAARLAERATAPSAGFDDPTEALRSLGYASDAQRRGGAWAAARARALTHLGVVWPLTAHLAAAAYHATLSRRALRERAAPGSAARVAEHSAGMRASLRAELRLVLALAQTRVALTLGLLCDRTLGRHELGAALLEYAGERFVAVGVAADATAAGGGGGGGDLVTHLLLPTLSRGDDGGVKAGVFTVPPPRALVQVAEMARASLRAVRSAVGATASDGRADDTGLLHRLALHAYTRAAAAAAGGGAPDEVVMLCSLRAI